MIQSHHPVSSSQPRGRWSGQAISASVRRAVTGPLRQFLVRRSAHHLPGIAPIPDSMRRAVEAADLIDQMRLALNRVEDQVIFGGVIFLNANPIGSLPTPDQAAVHSAALPPMDFYRWPMGALARFTARVVRKLAAPFMRRQERFNLDLLETLRRLEANLETQQWACRQLRHRVAELEQRLGPVAE